MAGLDSEVDPHKSCCAEQRARSTTPLGAARRCALPCRAARLQHDAAPRRSRAARRHSRAARRCAALRASLKRARQDVLPQEISKTHYVFH
eukprot:gene6940-biopygen5038